MTVPGLNVEIVRRSEHSGLGDLALQGEQALLQAETQRGPQVSGVPPSLTVDQPGGQEEQVQHGVVFCLGLDDVLHNLEV